MAPPNYPNNPSNQQRSKTGFGQTYGKYDPSHVKDQYWLARLPPKLFELWEEIPEGTLLGHLTFTKGTPAPSKTQQLQKKDANATSSTNGNQKPIQQKLAIQVKEDIVPPSHQSDLPLDYTLTNLTTKIPTLHPFTRRENGKIELHGTVARSCNLQMERTDRYREMCKSRLLKSVAGGGDGGGGNGFVKSVQNADLIRVNNVGAIGSGFGTSIAKFGKELLDAKNQLELYGSVGGEAGRKRKFDDSQSVRSILFELFSQQRYWSVKEMIAASGRGEKEIRVELKVIAESKRTGEFKGLWELKSEFAGNVTSNTVDG